MATVAGPIDVKVRADTTGLASGLAQGEQAVRGLRDASREARASAEALGLGIRQASQAAAQTAQATNAASAAVREFTQAERQALVQIREADGALRRLYAALGNDPTDASRARILRLAEAYQGFRASAVDASRATATTSAGLQQVGRASGQANQTLIDFSRTVNDVPYGIAGIANNLDPLIGGFQRLRASTGSARAAFAQLGRSLIGPAGLLTVINLLASAWILRATERGGVEEVGRGSGRAHGAHGAPENGV